MPLIVGLGNPGKEYAGSRHNLGFQVVEALSRRLNTGRPVMKHRSLQVLASHGDNDVVLAQPLTYMNRSGLAVRELLGNYHLSPAELLAVYDDLDLPPGTIRLRKNGGSAGHRGIQSIIDFLGTDEFSRLRIGIGRPPEGMDTPDFVLMRIEEQWEPIFNQAIQTAIEAILLYLDEGIESAMNRYNRRIAEADDIPK